MSQVQEGSINKTHLPYNISLITPTGGYGVEGLVDGTPLSLLVDTGAAVTLVRRETWDEIYPILGDNKLEPWMERKLMAVDGTPLRVFGCAKWTSCWDPQYIKASL